MSATRPKVCIVGAGALGLATALALAERDAADVVVLERDHVASGSSGISAGIVETQYVDPLDIELRVAAMRQLARLRERGDVEVVVNGYVRLSHDEAARTGFATSVEIQRELGVTDARVLEVDEIAARMPHMRVDDVDCGLFGPSDGFLDGHLYCSRMAEFAMELGVDVRVRDGLGAMAAGEPGRHELVTTRGETIVCDFIVNAAGAWADRVGALLGEGLGLKPQRHQVMIVHHGLDLGYLMPSVMDYTPHSGQDGLYFRHERAGQLLAGLHTEEALDVSEDPDAYTRGVDDEFVETLAHQLTYRLPGLDDPGLAHGWAGLYPVSPDGWPKVGPMAGDPTVIAAAGAGGSGIQLSPVIGELVADWIQYGEPRVVPAAARLRPGRLATTEGASWNG